MRQFKTFLLVLISICLCCVPKLQAQQSETIDLLILTSSQTASAEAAALGIWDTEFSHSQSLANAGVVGSETGAWGEFGEYNTQISSQLVAGTPGSTVSGLNLNLSTISSIKAMFGGEAEVNNYGDGAAACAVLETTQEDPQGNPIPGEYIASGFVSSSGFDDPNTGATTNIQITRGNLVMVDVWGQGGDVWGFTTQIVNGQPLTTPVFAQGGGNIDFSFFTVPGDVLEARHQVNLQGSVYSWGGLEESTATAQTVSDLKVHFHPF